MSRYNQLGGSRLLATDAAIASGLAFLTKELEKYDEKILEPLSSVTWARDMPVRTGGGFVESVRAIAMNYVTAGADEDGIISNKTTNIAVADIDLSEQPWRVFDWANAMRISYIDQQKSNLIGRNLEEMVTKSIRMAHDKALDKSVYVGFTKQGSTGLVNNASVASYTAAEGSGTGSPTAWADKTPDEILKDINEAMVYTWEKSEYDITGMANHILVPPKQYAMLVSRKVGTTGDKSLLTFLYENNIGKDQGITLSINPSRWCDDAGAGNADRMVCYANNEDRIRIDITVPLRRWITEASAQQMAYITPYVSQFSEVQFLYTQPVVYVDGI